MSGLICDDVAFKVYGKQGGITLAVYIWCYVFLCLISIIGSRTKNAKRVWMLASCTMLLVLVCLRDVSVGSDTQIYCNYFMRYKDLTWRKLFIFSLEPGYAVLNKLLSYVITDSQGFIFAMGIICLIPSFFFIRKFSAFPLLSIVIFYANFLKASEYLYRQWIAVLLLFCSFKYIVERKLVKFILIVVLSAFFHRTALVFLIVYPLYSIKITDYKLIMSGGISILLWATGSVWFNLFNLFARNELVREAQGGIFMLLFLWLCLLIIRFMFPNLTNRSWFKLFFVMLWFAAVTQPLTFTFSLWSRALLPFKLSLLFVFPAMFQSMRFKGKKFLSVKGITIELLFYVLLFVLFYANGIDKFAFYVK